MSSVGTKEETFSWLSEVKEGDLRSVSSTNCQVTAFAATATSRGSLEVGGQVAAGMKKLLPGFTLPPSVCTASSAKSVITYPSVPKLPKRHGQLPCVCLLFPSLVGLLLFDHLVGFQEGKQ